MSDKTTIGERRSHPRRKAELELHGVHESGEVVARMVTSDLSLGGVLCVSTADFPEMTRLAVRLMLPDRSNGSAERPVDLEAVVVRRETLASASGEPRFELALFFIHLQDGTKERLARFLAN